MTPALEHVVVTIAPGAADEFAALEGRMGHPFAGCDTASVEDSWWFSETGADGSVRRVFAFQLRDRIDLAGLIGPLGSPLIRLTIGRVDLTRFRADGPGSINTVRKKPPLIRPDMIDRIYSAANRNRLK